MKYVAKFSYWKKSWIVLNTEAGLIQSFWKDRLDAVRTASSLNFAVKLVPMANLWKVKK